LKNNKFFPLVTTTRKVKELDRKRALNFVKKYGGFFHSRNDESLADLFFNSPSTEDLVVFENGYPSLHKKNSSAIFRFHLNMAALRLDRLMKGGDDRYLDVAKIEHGMKVLDGTIGLGSDALVAAWKVGTSGKVIGLEASSAIFSIMDYTFSALKEEKNSEIAELIERIEIKNISLETYLETALESSFDIVYLDPMFDKPRKKSDGIDALREWARMEIPDEKTIKQALKAAKYRLVIKEPRASLWWRKSKISLQGNLTGHRYQSVRYRILEKEKA